MVVFLHDISRGVRCGIRTDAHDCYLVEKDNHVILGTTRVNELLQCNHKYDNMFFYLGKQIFLNIDHSCVKFKVS